MVRLSLSCGVYDRTLPLLLGLVQPDGIELDVDKLDLGRSMGSPDADIYEAPVVGMIMRRAREDTHRALPIFPKRNFFHQLILTREDSPLTGLAELRGKRVGLMNWYQHSMGVWLRGHLQESYGIRPEEIAWTTDRPNAFPMPEDCTVPIAYTPKETSLVEMLLAGELDALVHEQAHQFLLRHPGLRRLLPDHRVDETAYYHATGCFPLNHVLVARRELLEAEPGIVAALQAAFEASRQHALAIMDRSNVQVSVAWMDSLLEEERRRLGPDLFVDGLERTRPSIERLIRYLVEQQLIPEPLAVEEVFAG